LRASAVHGYCLPGAGLDEPDDGPYPHGRVDQCDRLDRSPLRGQYLQRHGSAERTAEDADRLVVDWQLIAQRGQRGREFVGGLVNERGQVSHQRVLAGEFDDGVDAAVNHPCATQRHAQVHPPGRHPGHGQCGREGRVRAGRVQHVPGHDQRRGAVGGAGRRERRERYARRGTGDRFHASPAVSWPARPL
jgi:hypothetical protein